MKRKPDGPEYRNLFLRAGMIYYARVIGGKRIRFSCKTNDWERAATRVRLYEERKGIGRPGFVIVESPTFKAFAKRYLDEDTHHLAPTTKAERASLLREDGPLMASFAAKRLDEITPAMLLEWWVREIEANPKRSTKTGCNYLDAVAAVFAYAEDLALVSDPPTGAIRAKLRRRARTKRGREEADRSRNVTPIEDPGELARLVEAARVEGRVPYVLVLLLLDAGLRVGEALALRWGRVTWGADSGDPRRALLVEESRSKGGEPTAPKSGRRRRVALSGRLRDALAELYRERFEPGPEAVVLEGVASDASFRMNEWRRICKRAGIGHRAMKDLRDTYASQLLTAGFPIAYIAKQLGHAQPSTTEMHYARWIPEGDDYRPPVSLAPGEVPADALARLVAIDPTLTPLPRGVVRRSAQPIDSARAPWIPGEDLNLDSQVQSLLSCR